MKEETQPLRHYLDYLQSQGQYWFLRKEAIARLKLTDAAFKLAAHRLRVKGKLIRVRSDFYTIIPPEYHAVGSLPASWFIHPLMQYLGQQYYVSLLTGASLHGVAHQQPMIFQVVTDKQTRPITIGQVRIEFLYKSEIHARYFQPVKTATGMMHVATPEMTAFDLVRYMGAAGQVSHVATVLCELAEQLKSGRLAELLESEDVEITAAQRLGYLLDFLKLSFDLEPLEKVLKGKKPVRRLLVTGIDQPIIEYNDRWHILVNETVEPDEL